MKSLLISFVLFVLGLGLAIESEAQSTSWTGAVSTEWRSAGNWTNGVPDENTDVIIGDIDLSGANQPILEKGKGSGNCNNLTLGNAGFTATLETNDALNISGTFTIGSNGTLTQEKGYIFIEGNFDYSGSYVAGDNKARIYMSGIAQNLGGASTITLEKLYISASSTTTLTGNIIVNEVVDLSGTLNPTENYSVSGAGDIDLRSAGTLMVMAATFSGNYPITGSLSFKGNNNTIDYGSSTLNQTIDNSLAYQNLRISGGMTKSLQANTTVKSNLIIDAGTLDILTFTINRNNNGGSLSVAGGATLAIGGTQSFPQNYASHILASTSTVHYYGGNQTVSEEDYGNLTLSSVTGTSVKTMPVNAINVAGNLTSSVTAGTLSFTASNNIDVLGNIDIGNGTTFDGSTFSHSTSGNVTVSGTYIGTSGSFISNGGNAIWSGSGTYTMGNLIVNGANTTLDQNTAMTIAGNLSTATSGTFTHSTGGTGSVNMNGVSKTISGLGIMFDDLTIASGASITAGSSFEIAGDLDVTGSFLDTGNLVTLSGTSKNVTGAGSLQLFGLTVTGSISTTRSFEISENLNVTGSFTATAGTITFNGTSDFSGTASLFNVTVDNGASLAMSVNASLEIGGADSLVGTGTFDGTSNTPNTVTYNSSGNQTINFSSFHNLEVSNGSTKSSAAALTVNGDLTIGTATTLEGSTYTHVVYGNWINNGTFTANTSTVQLAGTENTSVTGATTFSTLQVNKNNTSVVTLNNDVSASNVTMTAGVIQTGANTLTITSTRSGNGIILGTITRNHLFTTGTDYAFEGPNNIINFTSIMGVINSITVNVDNKTLSTFPYRESINRKYDITVGGAATYSASLRLHYETVDLNGNDETIMDLWNDQGTTTWINMGSSTKSAIDNWVEQTGLTSLEDKWSLSDGLKVVSWTGAVSTLATDAGNWSVTAGTPSIPPSADDVVVVGDKVFTNQPNLNVTATIKRIIFESTTASTASVAAGTTLTISGNILGDWTGGSATHEFNIGGASVNVNGDIELSDGTNGNAINLFGSTGTLNVLGSVQQSGGADITFTGSATMNISEDYEYSSGTLTPGSSTIVYQGTDNQIIAGVTYNNLIVNKSSGLATLEDPGQTLGDCTLSGGNLTIGNSLDIDGNLVIGAGTTLNSGSNNINLAGSLTLNGTLNPESSTFIFDGTGNQNIPAATYANFTINKSSGTATVLGDVYVKGIANVMSGTLDAGSHSIIRTSTGGYASLGAGSTVFFGGGSTQVQNFSTLLVDPASTVHFNGSVSRVIPPIDYGHLTFSNSGTKSLMGATTVKGDLTIDAGAAFDISNYSLALEGDMTVNGILTTIDSFLELNGTNKNINGSASLEDVLVNGSYDYQSGNPDFNGNLEIASTGDLDMGSSTVNVYGDLTNRGVAVSNGTVNFMGTQAQTIRLLNAVTSSSAGVINFNGTVAPILNSTSSPQFATVNINNTAGLVASAPWTVAVSMNVANGSSFGGGSLNHTFLGHFVNNGTVTSSGELTFSPIYFPSTITLGANFTNTGSVVFGGNQAITLTDDTPSFNLVTISNSNAAGVTASSAWNVSESILINDGAAFNAGSFAHTISGDFVNQGTFDGQTSTMTFDGATIIRGIGGAGSTTFNNLVFATGATLEVTSAIGVTGNCTHNATSLDLSNAAIEFSGSSLSVLSGSVPSINDLVINKVSNSVRMDVNATISNTLTMTSGNIDLNGNELSITNVLPGAISRTSGLILSESADNSSKVNWTIGTNLDNHVIPFGTISGDYIPFEFELSSGDAGTVTVSTYPTASDNTPYPTGVTNVNYYNADNSTNTVNRFFQIDMAGETSPNATITLSASSSEVGSINSLIGHQWNGTKWEDALPGQSATATSVTIPGVTQFSPWAMSGNGVPLPVKMISFEGQAKHDLIELEWSTATELNNEGFEVQRSSNGKTFEQIGYVQGNGTTDEVQNYSFQDTEPYNGLNYYRLKQVDHDDQFEYSSKVVVKMRSQEEQTLTFYPNPTNGSNLWLRTEGLINEQVYLALKDFNGRVVWQKEMIISNDHSEVELDLSGELTDGIYIMQTRTSQGSSYKKIRVSN